MPSAAHPDGRWAWDVLELYLVHDGDTFKARVDQGFDGHKVLWLRIAGINAPELKDLGGYESRDYLAGLLGFNSMLTTPVDQKMVIVTHRSITRDEDDKSFVRWVGDVYTEYNPYNVGLSANLAYDMVMSGHAVRVTKGLEKW